MPNQQMRYSAFITYRPVADYLVGDEPDTRPVDRLPSLGIAGEDSADARERALARACRHLEDQGYRIEKVERFEHCAHCHGTGRIQVKPRGWRRRSEPPWYLMRTVDCRHCPGERRDNAGVTPAPASATGIDHEDSPGQATQVR